MEVREGYKQTEVGEIPQEWDLKLFGDVITGFSSGATPYRGHPDFYNGNIRWITSGELNYNNILDTKEKITQEAVSKTNLKVHPSGTFLIAITGLEAKGTRGRCGFVGLPSTTNQSCMALYPIKELLDGKYLFYYYLWQGDFLAFKYCQGTKQQSYTASIAKKLPIIFPKLPEQQAIAEILFDTDNLIQSLERQLAKKHLIKQGMMQKLFVPKVVWKVRKLGEIAKTYGGLSGKTKSDFQNGKFPYIPFMNILSNPIIDTTYFDYVNIRNSESQNKAIKGDLFFNGSSETPEEVGMCSVLLDEIENLYLNSFCFGLRLFKQNEIYPLYYRIFSRSGEGRKLIFSLAQGATRYNLSKTNFLKLELPIPDFEQYYIANIFGNIDSEIGSLARMLTKYKSLKKGLMQNLLTGKIRLKLP